MSSKVEATIEDLYKIRGKAELVNGEIILMSPTGGLPSHAAAEICDLQTRRDSRSRAGCAGLEHAS